MTLLYDYKDTDFYNSMSQNNKASFDRLVDVYGEKLNSGNKMSTTLFTSHNFNNHCNNIIKIIDKIILNRKEFLTDKEKYLLFISILFHDISMAVNIECDRKIHSVQSADYLKEEFKNTSSSLYLERDKNNLSQNDIIAISKIIIAHSDVKDGKVKDNENGIFNKDLCYNNGDVKVKLLAAILRLADEMDITTDRLGSEEFAVQLSEDDDQQFISKQHWRNLHFFSNLQIDSEDISTLCLYCDDEYIRQYNDDITNIGYNIGKVKEKLDNEIALLNREVFGKKTNLNFGFTIKQTTVITKISELNTILYEKDNYSLFSMVSKGIGSYIDNNEVPDKNKTNKNKYPKNLDEGLYGKLNEFIKNNRLFSGGHYLITETYCATDWIDSNEIIETKRIINQCIKVFAQDIFKNSYDNDSIILGLDFSGSMIAAQLAYNTNMPFQYIISSKSKSEHAQEDINSNLPIDKNIILVTDVIATYSTIMSVITDLGIKERIKCIYTILYRSPNIQLDSIVSEYEKITYCISDSFPINIINREKCCYNENGCIAINKK